MKYFNVQKTLLKKTFSFSNYEWKSALIDLLGFFLFLILFLLVIGQIFFYSYQTNIFEQNYASLLQEESVDEGFRSEIATNYISIINTLLNLIVFSFFILLLLCFAGGTFLKVIQYRFLYKKRIKKFKNYFNIVIKVLRNTLPLFGALLLFTFALPLIFGIKLWVIIVMIIFALFYWFALSILRILSLRHRDFRTTWKTFFKMLIPKNAIYYSPFIKLSVLIFIILSFFIVNFNNLIITDVIKNIISIIYLFIIIYFFVFLRKYLFYTIRFIEEYKLKDGEQNKKQ